MVRSKWMVCFGVLPFVMLLCSPVLTPAWGEITEIGEFTGDVSEDFTSQTGSPPHVQTVSIFSGHVTANNLTDGGSIFVSSGSSLGGDQVNARSFPLAIAQLGVMEWQFHTPITQFGAWFENNSRFDDATLEFYDQNGGLIGSANATTPEAAQQWFWNGWHSDVAVHRIVSRGHDTEFLSGFIWYDDAQITFAASSVPEPSGGLLTCGVLACVGLRRRARSLPV